MSDITHYAGCWEDPKHHACALREIERLSTDYALLSDDYKQLVVDNARLRAENEKLGAAMSSDGADACGALVVAEAEIEWLNRALANRAHFEQELIGQMNKLRAAGVGYSQQTVDAITQEREKLRALLHESFDALTSNEDTCNDFCALRGEIWEALGHE